MAEPTPEQLADAYRAAQATEATATAAQIALAYQTLVDPDDDATFLAYVTVAAQLIEAGRRRISAIAGAFYSAHRLAVGVTSAPPEIAYAGELPREKVLKSLLSMGPATYRRALKRGLTVEAATQLAASRSARAAYRHAADGGRETIRDTVARDGAALGFARVTDGDPCTFCAMLASREVLYKTARSATNKSTSDDPYHDGCGCYPYPVYRRSDVIPGLGPELRQLWKDHAEGKSDPMEAFRVAYEQRYKTPPK